MAIMWDPPIELDSEPTPAEVAWQQWLMKGLNARTAAATAREVRWLEEGDPESALEEAEESEDR